MPTTIVSTIGTGGDYATIAAWNAACPADLVTADTIWEGRLLNQVHTSSGSTLNIAGSTVSDATRFKRLTCAPGASFRDNASKLTNALRVNSSNGAVITQTGLDAGAPTIVIGEAYFELIGVQVSSTTGASDGIDSPPALMVGSSTAKIRHCILESFSGNAVAIINNTLEYCLLIKRRHSGFVLKPNSVNNLALRNCTLVTEFGVSLSGGYNLPGGIQRNYNVTTLNNVALFGCASITSGVGTTTANNCYSDSTAITGFTQVAFDTSTGSGFENITNDFRIKTTSALRGAGATYSGILTEDIIGQTVGSPPSAGAWDPPSGGGTPATFTGTIPTLTPVVGTPFTFDFSSYFSGSFTPIVYTEVGPLPSNGLSLSGTTITGTPSSSGLLTNVRIVGTDANSNVANSNFFSIDIQAAATLPVVTTQPTNQTVTAPNTATFTYAATGTGLSFQAQRNPGGNTSFANVSGASSTTYTTPATTVTGGTANNGDTYRIAITNTAGTVYTNVVTLTVNAAVVNGTLTLTTPLVNNTGPLSGRLANINNLGIAVIDITNNTVVANFSNRSTDASGVLTSSIVSSSIVPGQSYRLYLSSGTSAGISQILIAT
jgi:hypothetical protein